MSAVIFSLRRAPLIVAITATLGATATARGDVVLNEVLGSTTGADSEFVELFNTGAAEVDLSGWSVELWDSDADRVPEQDGGSPYVLPAGATIAPGAFYVLGNGTAEGAFAFTADAPLPSNAIENSSYTIVLRGGDGTVRDSAFVTDGDAGDFANVDGVPIAPTFSVGPDGPFLPAGYLRDTDGGPTASVQDFFLSTATPGTTNAPDAPPADEATIMAIQGAGHVSPLLGERVLTTGVVTAVAGNGFYLQDPVGDGDPATSDAVFVFTGSAPSVAPGDSVEVIGDVSEFTPGGTATRNLSTTQIAGGPEVSVLSSGNDLPDPVRLGAGGRVPPAENIDDDAFAVFEPETDGIDFFEAVEAMRVLVPQALAIAPTNRFEEIFTVGDLGALGTGLSARGTLNIAPDDFNPEKIQIDFDGELLPGFDFPFVDAGSVLGDVVGVIGYDFGNFQVFPTEPFAAGPSGLLPETTELEDGTSGLTIATYNVLNLDPNDADGDRDVALGRFDAIATQIVDALGAPAIIGLQEVQDEDGSVASGNTSAEGTLALLVERISAAGGPAYAFADTPGIVEGAVGGQPGGNIRVAFLYDPARVTLVGEAEPLTDPAVQGVDPSDPFFGSRISLAATFEARGETLTVVNNHFSSKGGSAPILGVEQPFDERQEEVEVNGSLDERRRQATAVAAYVDDVLATDPDARVVVLGDLNEFEFVSPVQDILGSRLANTTLTIDPGERYTFIFQGNSQSLDHVLVSPRLAADGVDVDIVHVNVEFAEVPSRASDHEPIVTRIALPLSGDVDGDGDLDVRDLVRLVKALGSRAGSPRYDAAADLDGDGDVDRFDLRRFLRLLFEALRDRR